MKRIITIAAIAVAAVSIAGALLNARPADRQPAQADASGGVSTAAFNRLEGEVQDLQRRVAALEKKSGSTGGKPPHTAGDNWLNPQ